MENKNKIVNEIEEIAPFLSKLKKDNVFEVPELYFENITVNVHKHNLNKEDKKFRLYNILEHPQYAIAASLIVILIVSAYFFIQHKPTEIAKNNTIYWDEVLNDNTVIEKVDEAMLVEAYIDETHQQIEEENSNNQIISSEDISDFVEKEYSNDIFNEL